MEEEIQLYLDDAEDQMNRAADRLITAFSKIRAGKANPAILEGLKVNYYGAPTPLQQVANISAPEPRLIVIKPWEKKMLQEIERAVMNSDLGFNPQSDGEVVRIPIPPLSEERRHELVKKARTETENSKVQVRSVRKETNEGLKKLQKEGISEDSIKRAEDVVQKLTDKSIAKLDELMALKEKDILTI